MLQSIWVTLISTDIFAIELKSTGYQFSAFWLCSYKKARLSNSYASTFLCRKYCTICGDFLNLNFCSRPVRFWQDYKYGDSKIVVFLFNWISVYADGNGFAAFGFITNRLDVIVKLTPCNCILIATSQHLKLL